MKQLSILTFLVAVLFAVSALAASQSQRVRGTIDSFNNNQLVVHTRFGKTKTVALNDKTTYLDVVKSSLSKVSKNDFIGTATHKEKGKLVALEVVIFPDSMRGTGEGHYPWDKLPNPASQSKKLVSSSMTNGTIESASSAQNDQRLVSSSKTNGSVQSSQEAGGAKKLTLTYKGGEKHIIVPPNAPIVAFQKADHSVLKKGAKVFIHASDHNGQLTADAVAVGQNGIKPPM